MQLHTQAPTHLSFCVANPLLEHSFPLGACLQADSWAASGSSAPPLELLSPSLDDATASMKGGCELFTVGDERWSG